jgi:hypothetical protein
MHGAMKKKYIELIIIWAFQQDIQNDKGHTKRIA